MPRRAKHPRADASAAASSAASASAASASTASASAEFVPDAATSTRSRRKRPSEASAPQQTSTGSDDGADAAPSKRPKVVKPPSGAQSSSAAASSVISHAPASGSSTPARRSARHRSPIALLAPVELQLIFSLMSFEEMRHCWSVNRRWYHAASNLTHSFLQHQGHDGRLRISRSAFLLLLQSPMRLLVNDLAVLLPSLDPGDESDDESEGVVRAVRHRPDDDAGHHSLHEYDEDDRKEGSDLDPSALTREHICSLADRMPQLRHLTAKLAQDLRRDDDTHDDSDDESDAEDMTAAREQQVRRLAAEAKTTARLLANDVTAGTTYRFPSGLVSLRVSPINDRWLRGVGLQIRRVILSASQLSSLELLSISLREPPKVHRLTFGMCLTVAPWGPPMLPGCLTPLMTGAARESLRILRLYHSKQQGGKWKYWSAEDVHTAFALPHLQRLRLPDRHDGLSAGLGQVVSPQLREIEEWSPILNLAGSQAIARLTGLRILDCELLDDADPTCLGALTQLEVMRVECGDKVDPVAFSTALSHCTHMQALVLTHTRMTSPQLTTVLASMPALHSLTLKDMMSLEDFSFLSAVPSLALTLRWLNINEENGRSRKALNMDRHLSHVSALKALNMFRISSFFTAKLPRAAWTKLHRAWQRDLPNLHVDEY